MHCLGEYMIKFTNLFTIVYESVCLCAKYDTIVHRNACQIFKYNKRNLDGTNLKLVIWNAETAKNPGA